MNQHVLAVYRNRQGTSGSDSLGTAIWIISVILGLAAVVLRHDEVLQAATDAIGPFLSLAAVIAAGMLEIRLGVFRAIAGTLIPANPSTRVAFGAILTITALLSGFINLDVAVVVAMPLAIELAARQRLPLGSLAIAVAVTANATSFFCRHQTSRISWSSSTQSCLP